MRIRIHFAVGSTAMAKTVDIKESFTVLCDAIERSGRDDKTIRFMANGDSIAIAAKSVVLIEQVSP